MYVNGEGPEYTPLAIVGEAPGKEEDETGRPFVGQSGQLLNQVLHALGIDRRAVYITNVIKERPLNNATPSMDEIERAMGSLGAELLEHGVDKILAMGKVPRDALLPQLRNEPMRLSRECSYSYRDSAIKVYVTWHPSYVIRNGRSGQVMAEFMDDIRHWYVGA